MLQFTPEFITATGGILVILGGGLRFLVIRFDKRSVQIEENQRVAREKLEKLFQSQIDVLKEDNRILREEVARYVRHVGVLEGMLKQAGIEIPKLG